MIFPLFLTNRPTWISVAKVKTLQKLRSQSKMTEQGETSYKVGLGVWFCFCVLLSMWMFTKFMKGKQQLFSNLHVVEDSLLKMQEKMELSQRKKSMGYVENLDDLTASLTQNNSNICEQTQQEAENNEAPLMKTENEIGKIIKHESKGEITENKKDN